MSAQDRRRSPRIPLVLKVRTLGEGPARAFQTGDVSEHGAFVQSTDPIAVGERVILEVSFPGLLSPEILSGVVRWTRPPAAVDDEEIPAGYGVEFTETPGDSFLTLVRAAKVGPETLPEVKKPRKQRVLIADDNPHIRKILTGALMRSAGKLGGIEFDVLEAKDGGETIAMLDDSPVDLLILDLYMPVIDGRGVLGHIRARPDLATLPVLVVSAGGNEERAEALDAGADFFLGKPLRLVDILETVRVLLHLEG